MVSFLCHFRPTAIIYDSLSDPCPSISHILVLPPHPNAVAAMTPTAVDNQDGLSWFLDGGGGTDPGASDPSLAGFDDIFSSALGDMDLGEAFQTTQLVTPGTEDVRAPLAVGFLISTTPPGLLPEEFWGHDRPQTMCSMFKVRDCSKYSTTYSSNVS